jgi:hypothetical protein
MPEWQGAGVGTAFLNEIMQYHLEGKGRCNRKYPTYFHTSHPQLCGYLRYSPKWKQVSAKLTGDNKARSIKSLHETGKGFDGAKRKQPEDSADILEQYRDLNI